MRLARWLLERMAGMGQMPSINRILLILGNGQSGREHESDRCPYNMIANRGIFVLCAFAPLRLCVLDLMQRRKGAETQRASSTRTPTSFVLLCSRLAITILLVLSLIAIAHPADCANVTNQTETQILIDGDGYVLENGERRTFYQNYTVVVKGVDAKGEKAWIELLQNDVTVGGGIFKAMDHLSYVKEVEIFNMTIDQIYVGSQNDLVFFYVRQYPDSDLPACDPPPSDATPESGSNTSDSDASAGGATSTPAGGHDPDPNSVPGCGVVVAVAAIVLSWLNWRRAGGKRRRI